MPRYLSLVLRVVLGAVLVCISALIVLSLIPLDWAAPWIGRQLGQLANRPVHIEGAMRLDWRWPVIHDDTPGWLPQPVLHAGDITVGNADWASNDPVMLSAEQVRVQLDLAGLSRQVVHLTDLGIYQGHLLLQRQADGTSNWTFDTDSRDDESDGWQLVIRRLMLEEALVRLMDDSRDLDVELLVSTVDGSPVAAGDAREHDPAFTRGTAVDQDAGTTWHVSGRYRNVDVRGQGRMGQVLALQSGTESFPLQGELHVGATTLRAQGHVTRPRDLSALDFQFELSGPTMADLYPILGLALPHTPPYQTTGRLSADLDASHNTWTYESFTGTVGKSDLSGTLTYQQRDPRPLLSGELNSDLLRFEDLGPLIGAPSPQDGDTQDGETQGQLTRNEPPPDDKVLPVSDADGRQWQVMDADVTFAGQRIESQANLPLDDVRTHVFLEDGVLRFEPLNFGVAGGTLESTVTLDGNVEPIDVTAEVSARGLQLSRLFPGVESMDAALGSVHGDADLSGRGNSVSELLAHASGDLSAVVTRGTVSRFLLEAAGLNVANMVFVKLFGDEQVMVQCLAADFHIEDGVVRTRTFILETDDAVVTAEGEINLATEEMDLSIHPDNKSLRVFTFRSPLYVAGTFKEPDVGVQKGPVAARAGTAVALGLVATPLAALLPLLNIGTDDETTCASAGKGASDAASSDGDRLTGSVPGANEHQP